MSGHAAAGMDQVVWLCAAFVGVEVLRGLVLVVAWTHGVYWWDGAATVLRANVLRSILTAPGAAADRQPHSPGESIPAPRRRGRPRRLHRRERAPGGL
ncbi:hypothetical protein C1I98_26440 [Spongiactinospora gelatinilytica]|uniref:Uncharacterized protein n=1 Tax=Spongiactinospora gelatinilytica TaxID=2666298 RepID=A0A2W2G991_9ACTN|nr:hypothetical protein [Spongiactinospora gelatinilytica]PZG36775.1 hypothetical protein C1I98_26440 [Spongiactinospora gelatinilytica]